MKASQMSERLALVAAVLDDIGVEPSVIQHGVGETIGVQAHSGRDFLQAERTFGLTRAEDDPGHGNVYADGRWLGMPVHLYTGKERFGNVEPPAVPTTPADIDEYIADHSLIPAAES